MLRKLIARGDVVGVNADGILVITPVSGNPVPAEWLALHQADIIREIRAIAYRLGVLPHQVFTADIQEFISSGKKLVAWQTDDEWMAEYNLKNLLPVVDE